MISWCLLAESVKLIVQQREGVDSYDPVMLIVIMRCINQKSQFRQISIEVPKVICKSCISQQAQGFPNI